jgi:putative membrane protein
MDVKVLPHFEAACDIVAAILLLCGYYLVRRGYREAHKACMLSALLALVSSMGAYAVQKYLGGTIKFAGQGHIRTIYFATLYGHSLAAALAMPLAAAAIYFAARGNFDRHKKVARWTLPIWFFSALAGIVIHFILFHATIGNETR